MKNRLLDALFTVGYIVSISCLVACLVPLFMGCTNGVYFAAALLAGAIVHFMCHCWILSRYLPPHMYSDLLIALVVISLLGIACWFYMNGLLLFEEPRRINIQQFISLYRCELIGTVLVGFFAGFAFHEDMLT